MLEPGDAVDVWVVDHALGAGGMGSVYRCHNRNAPRILAAVKVLDLPSRRQAETTARFVREAEILFGLNHKNIVKVRNIRTEHDPPYLEMEFVEGESLEDALQRGPLPLEKGLDVIRQCAMAVQYLHKRGVRHRDIKPANFLLRSDGRVKLVDFGLALEQDVSRITQAGMAFGTVSYAPPEWANPEHLDPVKWDLYALGVVMYEVLTGEVAFPVSGQGSARQQAMQVVLSKQKHEPLDPGGRFPDDIRALIRDLTMSEVDERLSDSVEVLRRLGLEVIDGRLGPSSEEDHPSVITTVPTPGLPVVRQRAPATWTEEVPAPAAPTAHGASILAGAALSMAGVGVALIGIAVLGAALFYATLEDRREVQLVLSGITADTPHEVAAGGQVPDARDGLSYRFDELPIGATEVAWVVGDGCSLAECAAQTCSPVCGYGTARIEIDEGSGTAMVPVHVPAPSPRAVRVTLPPLPDDVAVAVRVADEPARAVRGGVTTAPLLPGPHEALLALGTCPDDVDACSDDCPEGCLAVATELLVPWSGPADAPEWPDVVQAWELATAPPEPEPQPATPTPRRDAPVPSPAPAPRAGALVTQAQLAEWLQSEEGRIYQPGAIKGYTMRGHLTGWTDATPPNPSAHVVGIAFPLAREYCNRRGGLPTVDDALPAKATMEWRARRDGKAAILMQGDTVALETNGVSTYVPTASFRCRR